MWEATLPRALPNPDLHIQQSYPSLSPPCLTLHLYNRNHTHLTCNVALQSLQMVRLLAVVVCWIAIAWSRCISVLLRWALLASIAATAHGSLRKALTERRVMPPPGVPIAVVMRLRCGLSCMPHPCPIIQDYFPLHLVSCLTGCLFTLQGNFRYPCSRTLT